MRDYGGMISVDLKTDKKGASKFLTSTKVFLLAESLGGVESKCESPALMTHSSIDKKMREKLGIHDGLIRLSIGIEDVEDLLNDLDNALKLI